MTVHKALIFDMDGVLVDSEPLHQRDWLVVFRQFGVEFPETELKSLQGLRGEQVIEVVRRRAGAAAADVDFEALIAEKRRLFVEASISQLTEVPGAETFLRRHKGHVPLALVTSARLKIVGQVLFHFNWRNIFDALVGAEHVTHSKPHPEPFLKAVERFRLRAGDCLVFEDSIVGVQGARAAGCWVCGVTTTSPERELRSAGAHWTIRDFEDTAALERALEGRSERPGWLRRLFRRA